MHPRLSTTRRVLVLALLTAAVPGCTRDNPHGTGQPPAAPVAAGPAPGVTAMAPVPPAAGEGVSGTVVETMDAGGYTYAKLDRGTTQVWVAGPETKLAVGTRLGTMTGTAMPGFHSATLNRTFDEIYFITSFAVTGSAPATAPTTTTTTTTATPEVIEKIEPAAGGQTIAQVFAGKVTLAGKPVVVRGKVVKLNNGILGRNWIHIRDGSGSAGTNDLTVTTSATVALADVVVVRGTLATDKDFGAGYKYDVLVESAEVTAK